MIGLPRELPGGFHGISACGPQTGLHAGAGHSKCRHGCIAQEGHP